MDELSVRVVSVDIVGRTNNSTISTVHRLCGCVCLCVCARVLCVLMTMTGVTYTKTHYNRRICLDSLPATTNSAQHMRAVRALSLAQTRQRIVIFYN